MIAYEILRNRGVTRLCHFTKLQSLTHIITATEGILASSSIRQDTKNVTDVARYDGELDHICCSIEYPNSWFLDKAISNNTDLIFREWVVLYVDLLILKSRSAKFCPCNASREKGSYICEEMSDIDSIFAPIVPTFKYPRSKNMLDSCPTDGQAEILIKDTIPREFIIGIAVGTIDVAKRVYSMLKIYGLETIPIYISPNVLSPFWSSMIKIGKRPDEELCKWSEED